MSYYLVWIAIFFWKKCKIRNGIKQLRCLDYYLMITCRKKLSAYKLRIALLSEFLVRMNFIIVFHLKKNDFIICSSSMIFFLLINSCCTKCIWTCFSYKLTKCLKNYLFRYELIFSD